jgi:Zn-dependent protease with chaperone function
MYAHASGFSWDEGLLVLAPIAVVFVLLFFARRRETRAHRW